MTETFESSVHEEGTGKFHLDRTLYKGIKYSLSLCRDNDVSKIIDVSREGGAIEQRLLSGEGEELALVVAEMRRKYDEVRTETRRLEAEMNKNKRHE